jgi:hypothetical protein
MVFVIKAFVINSEFGLYIRLLSIKVSNITYKQLTFHINSKIQIITHTFSHVLNYNKPSLKHVSNSSYVL